MLDLVVIAQAGGADGGMGCLGSMVPLILIFLIFWFIVIRPEQKKQQAHQEFLNSLKVGDQVVTAGGVFGEVKAVDGETIKLQVTRDTRLRVLRQQIKGPQEEYLGGDEEDQESTDEQPDDQSDDEQNDDNDDADEDAW